MKPAQLPLCLLVILLSFAAARADRIAIPAGFPNADNTGCSGTLTPSSSITVSVDGTVIENMQISGGVRIEADNVTVRNCHIIGGLYGVQVVSGYTGALIEDCTIYDGTSKGILGANFTARRCDVSEYSDSILIGSNVLIEDCYLHDFKYTDGSHNDGVQTTGASNITIRGCTIQAFYQNQTSAIIFQTQYAVIDNILIENNFLSGGSYSVYMRNKDTGFGDPTNVNIINNVFEYDSYAFGPLSTDGDGITYSDNIYHTGEAMWVNPTVNNRPPGAEAGTDQTLEDFDNSGTETVTLDGSASGDLDGTIVSHVWTDGSQQISTASQFSTTLGVGIHTITLTVTDDDGDTDSDTVTITVNPYAANQPPTANAGPQQTVIDGDNNGSEEVTLDGSSSSDSDGSIVSYVWSQNGTPLAAGISPVVTLGVGIHTITLTVTDDDGDTGTDTVTITVDPYGSVPTDIALDAASSSYVTGSATLSWNHTLGDGYNRAVVVGIASEEGTFANFEVLSATFNGVAMTAAENSIATAGAGTRTQTQLFYILDADLPASGTYTVEITRTGTNARQSGGAVSLENVAQQAPEAVVANVPPSTASSLSTDITTLTDGAWIVDVIGQGQGGYGSATAIDQVEQWSLNLVGAAHAGSTKHVATAGTTNMAWSFTSTHLIASSLAAFAPVESAIETPHPGDANGDNTVNLDDFIILKTNYGTATGATWSMGDFDENGKVNLDDFIILKSNYGWTSSE